MTSCKQNVYACDEVLEVLRLHGDLLAVEARNLPVRDQLDRQARRIAEAHKEGDRAVVTHIKCWHPRLIGHSADEIMGLGITLDDARETIAREYGFADWEDAGRHGIEPPDGAFELTVDTLLRGDIDALSQQLSETPALVAQRSAFGHRATLLHYCGANGVETYRQVVPYNLAKVTQVLIDAGADVNATAGMYGGGSTTIGLLVSSSHPHEAGVADEVIKVLIDAGALTE